MHVCDFKKSNKKVLFLYSKEYKTDMYNFSVVLKVGFLIVLCHGMDDDERVEC